jgi:replicative DNA helicase
MKNENNVALSTYHEFSSGQPITIEVENSLIAAIINNPNCIDQINPNLLPKHFANDKNQLIFEAMQKLCSENIEINELSINNLTGIDAMYLVDFRLNRLLIASPKILSNQLIHESEELVLRALINNTSFRLHKSHSEIADMLDKYRARVEVDNDLTIDELIQSDLASRNISTGVLALDDVLKGGFAESSYNLFGAPTGLGKTSFMLSLAINMCRDRKVLYMPLETSSAQLTISYIKMLVDLYPEEFESKYFLTIRDYVLKDDSDLFDSELDIKNKAIKKVSLIHKKYSNENLYFKDGSRKGDCELNNVISNIRRYVRDKQVEVVFVDYIGLITVNSCGQNLFMAQTEISRRLKLLAIELGIVINTAVQYNKTGTKEMKENGSYELEHITGSSEHANSSNLVIFINSDRTPVQAEGKAVNLDIKKNRAGNYGKAEAKVYPSGLYKSVTKAMIVNQVVAKMQIDIPPKKLEISSGPLDINSLTNMPF